MGQFGTSSTASGQGRARADLGIRAVCLLFGFGLAYLVFGTSGSSTLVAVLTAVAILVLLTAFESLPSPPSGHSPAIGYDPLESAVLFSEARATATAAERQRIARDIHDGVAQDLASLGYLVDDLGRGNDQGTGRVALVELRDELTRILAELRMTVSDLRTGVSSQDRLGPVLTDYAVAIGKRSSLEVHLAIEESTERLQLDVETDLLRIAQEALTNAATHASAANLWVTCRVEPPFATLRIDDDGVGAATPRADHFGLHIMQERAERIGAVLAIDNRPEGGTRVSAILTPRESPESDLQLGGSDALQRPSHR
jgi:signal transduction histidine kinase